MLQRLRRHDINDARWNAAVDASTTPLPYAYTWYLDLVAPRWEGLVNGDYEAVMPLTAGKKFGVAYLYQPFFTQQLGIFSRSMLSDDAVNMFMNKMARLYKFIEINFHYAHAPIRSDSFATTTRVTHHLSLDAPYDIICQRYNDNLKRNLKKSSKQNLIVKHETDGAWLIDMFRNEKGKTVSELKPNDYKRLHKLMETVLARKCGMLLSVNHNDEKIGGGFFVNNHRYLINLFPVSNTRGRDLHAMSILLDHVLHGHSNSDLIFDFEGSQIDSISRFYKSFGAQPVAYMHLKYDALPWHMRLLKRLKDGT